jgi:hypothetical protein
MITLRLILSLNLLISASLYASTISDNQLPNKSGLYECTSDLKLNKLDDGRYYISTNGTVKKEYADPNGMLQFAAEALSYTSVAYTGWKMITGSKSEIAVGAGAILAGAASTTYITKDMELQKRNTYNYNVCYNAASLFVISVVLGFFASGSKENSQQPQ